MLLFFQIILGTLVITSILLQSRGAGIGSAWGGGGEFYSTRRGVEKLLFRATIILVILFSLVSLVQLVL
ncbi:MAG: preprotein translocase subunit SecG [Patescibacteria group bacterium]